MANLPPQPPQMPPLQRQSQMPPPPPPPPQQPPMPPMPPIPERSSFVNTTLPMLIMVSALAGLGILGWYAYQEATNPRDVSDLPVIKADNEPYKIKPTDPGGMDIPNLDKTVYNTLNENAAVDAPTQVRPTNSIEEPISREQLKDMAGQVSEEPAAVGTAPQILGATDENAADAIIIDNDMEASAVGDLATKVPAGSLPSEAVGDIDGGAASGSPFKHVPVPQQRPDAPAAAVVAEKTAAAPVAKKPAAPVKASPIKAPASMEKAAPRADAVSEKNNFAQGIKVQLGAFRSTDELNKVWQQTKAKHPDLLGSYSYAIQKADLGAKGVFYRLHVGPIKNNDTAHMLCKKLIAKGQGCFVVK